jgi:hypothetical protein
MRVSYELSVLRNIILRMVREIKKVASNAGNYAGEASFKKLQFQKTLTLLLRRLFLKPLRRDGDEAPYFFKFKKFCRFRGLQLAGTG